MIKKKKSIRVFVSLQLNVNKFIKDIIDVQELLSVYKK